MQIQHLPLLIETDRAEHLIIEEIPILDLAESIIKSGDEALRPHVDAITLANELCYLHQEDNPTDEAAHLAAEQLKLFHLDCLDRYFDSLVSDKI